MLFILQGYIENVSTENWCRVLQLYLIVFKFYFMKSVPYGKCIKFRLASMFYHAYCLWHGIYQKYMNWTFGVWKVYQTELNSLLVAQIQIQTIIADSHALGQGKLVLVWTWNLTHQSHIQTSSDIKSQLDHNLVRVVVWCSLILKCCFLLSIFC